MKLVFRIFAPLLIVAAALWLAVVMIRSRPEPRKFSMPPQITKVEATRLQPESFQVFLETQGTIRPRTTTTLVPEVNGRIIEVAPNFRDGRFFRKDEVLVRLDPINYETQLIVAESNVAQEKVALQEEIVRGEQAVANWKRLGKSGTPSELAARKPQLAEAQARLRAAEAEVRQAQRDLERTEIKAPFNGRIIEQNVDVGQFVSSNTQLARAFATDVMEVRLPLTNRQLSFVDLPNGRAAGDAESAPGAEVLVETIIGRDRGQWAGRIVRVDSAIDESSRQLFVVAEIDDPYGRQSASDAPELKIGLFVDALVKGEMLSNVFVLPRQAVRVGGEVIVIDEENRIRRQKVEAVWSEDDKVIVPADGGGLSPGDVVCLTPLAYPANGALVFPTIDGITPEIEQPVAGGFPRGKGKGGKGEKGKAGGKKRAEPEGETSSATEKGRPETASHRGDSPAGVGLRVVG